MDLVELFLMQKKYNDKIYGDWKKNPNVVENYTQDLALCAHAEISELISATKYKKHHSQKIKESPAESKILYESVDVIRYIVAILNLWNIDSSRFESAFKKKDIYLNTRNRIDNKKWAGQPVAIIDMDDVIVDFRCGLAEWLGKEKNIQVDVESNEYYFITGLREHGVNPEKVFLNFVAENGFETLSIVPGIKNFLQDLKDEGYWIHILTARPESNLNCFYDTFSWLDKHDIVFDDISFASEKFRWCAQSKYYDSNSIKFAIDDSPKHASEYASHDIKVFVPKKSYNAQLKNKENVFLYSRLSWLFKRIISID